MDFFFLHSSWMSLKASVLERKKIQYWHQQLNFGLYFYFQPDVGCLVTFPQHRTHLSEVWRQYFFDRACHKANKRRVMRGTVPRRHLHPHGSAPRWCCDGGLWAGPRAAVNTPSVVQSAAVLGSEPRDVEEAEEESRAKQVRPPPFSDQRGKILFLLLLLTPRDVAVTNQLIGAFRKKAKLMHLVD